MKLMTIEEAGYIENKYLHLAGLQNNIGKVKAVVKTQHELDELSYKVVVAIHTENVLNDKFYDLDEFCNLVDVEYSEE